MVNRSVPITTNPPLGDRPRGTGRRRCVLLATLLLVGAVAEARFPGGPQTITRDAPGANVVHAADLDGDGDADVLSASYGDDKIAWYENLGEGEFSEPNVLTTDADFARWVMAADLDGDGDLDVLSASDYDDKVSWYENVGGGRFITQRNIATDFDQSLRLDVADFDGDLDVVASGHELAWFENLGNAGSWARNSISPRLESRWNVKAADLDGDGDADVVNSATTDNKLVWHRNDGEGVFSEEIVITTGVDRPIGIEIGDIDGDGDLDLVSASRLDDKVAWYENLGDGSFADQRVITDRADNANAVHLADIDGDGDLDVLSASSHDNRIAWYENLCNREFSEPKIITTAVAAPWSVYAADLDGDGDVDVLSASEGDRRVAWYENRTPEGVHFAVCTFGPAPEAGSTLQNAHAADLDNDGDLDLVSSDPLRWYENTGAGFLEGESISEDADESATGVHAADLDGDGDADLAVARSWPSKISWYENTGGEFGTERTIFRPYANAVSAVSAADLDGDGDLDLASASRDVDGNAAAWHENLAHRFEQRLLPGTTGVAHWIHIADLDGDGHRDLLAAAEDVDGEVPWWPNSGNGEFEEQRVIGTGDASAESVFAADLDDDGDLDVLSALKSDDTIAWYENQGGRRFSERRAISANVGGAESVAAADFDGDGDIDVLYAAYGQDRDAYKGTAGWFENLGDGTFRRAFEVAAEGAVHALPTDIDADGDPDIVVTMIDPYNKLVLYRNLSRLGTPPTAAPGRVAATATTTRLQITWLAVPASAVGGSYITRYVATAQPSAGGLASTCEVQPPALTCTIEGLQPATAYAVTVHAENSRGAGPASTAIRVQTLALPGAYRFVAERATDGAGFSLAHTADRDGDGNADVAIGAPFHSSGRLDRRGAVYLVASSDLRAADAADGSEDGGIYLHNVAGRRNSYKLVGERAGDNAGWSVAGIDDLDGDGTDDLAVGAPNGGTQAAYLVAAADLAAADRADGTPDGLIELRFAGRQANSWKIIGARGDRVGSNIGTAGDIDDDDRNEVLLFANGETEDSPDAGVLYVLDPGDLPDADTADGSADRSVQTRHLPAQAGTWRFVGDRLGGPVGGIAAAGGDADADGSDDLLIGSPRSSPRDQPSSGTAFLAASADFPAADAADGTDGTIHLDNLAAMSASWQLIGEHGYDEAGASIAGAGDIDGDGRSDLIVGAPGHSHGGGFLGGAAYLATAAGLSSADAADGTTDGSIDLAAIAGQAGSFKFVGDSLDGAGVSLAAAGDPDGDGVADLLIGAQGQAAWLIAVDDLPGADAADGSADGVVALGNVAGQANSYKLALGSGRLYPTATSLAAAGDIDGDRAPDLLLGVSGGVNGGTVYLLSTRDLAAVDAADGVNDAVLQVDRIGPATLPLPVLRIDVGGPPADVRRGIGKAQATVRWRVSSPWQAHPPVDYTVTTDEERIAVGAANGTLAVGSSVETSLEFDCTAPERIAATVTIRVGNASRGTPWTVYCTSGNAADLVVELHQGPMAWQWDSLAETTTTHVAAIHGRRAALVVETVAETSAVPVPAISIRDANGATVSNSLPVLVGSDGPETRSGFYATTRVLDLSAELHVADREVVVELPSDAAGTTERVSYAIALPGRTLPKFDITFFPFRSGVGTPAEFEAADYMLGIFDLFPIADDHAARVGDEHEYRGGGWDVATAALELLSVWNAEAEPHEYYHGIFDYPSDGSSCGYAWVGRPVAVSAALDDGCTPNIHPHELGHNFGLPHAPGGCGTGNVDPEYPYDNAGIGPRRGWLFSEGRFVNPDDGYFDTMSYCRPNFISDYNYRKVVEFLTPDEEETPTIPASAAAIPATEDGGESAPAFAARSIALTGTVDAAGNWSLAYATTTDRAPRPSTSGAFTLEILGANAGILHTEPLAIHPDNEGTLWAWTARVPFPQQDAARVVVRDAKGIVLDSRLPLVDPASN